MARTENEVRATEEQLFKAARRTSGASRLSTKVDSGNLDLLHVSIGGVEKAKTVAGSCRRSEIAELVRTFGPSNDQSGRSERQYYR